MFFLCFLCIKVVSGDSLHTHKLVYLQNYYILRYVFRISEIVMII